MPDILPKNRLIVFGGLPGTGKTTLARGLAARLHAVYLRIDTIEQALRRADALKVGDEGYLLAYEIAVDNLRAGNAVIADSVNPIPVTRDAWQDVAARAGVEIFEIEIICSDEQEHRRRVETRKADIQGHKVPLWQDVVAREYHRWDSKNLTIDTFERSVEASLDEIIEALMKTAL